MTEFKTTKVMKKYDCIVDEWIYNDTQYVHTRDEQFKVSDYYLVNIKEWILEKYCDEIDGIDEQLIAVREGWTE